MAAPTGATLPLPSKTQDFHLIRPVCTLGTFPSRGRLENAFLFLVLWFLTVSHETAKPALRPRSFITAGQKKNIYIENKHILWKNRPIVSGEAGL